MRYKHLLYLLVATSLALSSFIVDQQFTASKKAKPNFVFILADDCTVWDLGTYGSADAITPHINQLASEGMKFNRAYQAAPMCSPTRHNLYTGLYPVKTGAYPNHTFARAGTQSIVHHLKPLGYRVAQSGKRHISPEEVFPFEYLGNKNNPDFTLIDGFLKEAKTTDQPFALMLCSNEPHTPWDKGDASRFDPDRITLPPHYVDTPETREAFAHYLAEINYLDGQVGQTMELLKKHGFDKNTLVIFASEQGNSFPFAKWTLYEAGVRSGLIAWMPGTIKAGRESEAIVEYTDILPTFIDMAGGTSHKNLDGKSLWPILKGKMDKVKDYSYSLNTTRGVNHGSDYYGSRAIVNEGYRYILNLTPEVEFLNTVNNNPNAPQWYHSWEEKAQTDPRAQMLVQRYKNRPGEELYNIKDDPWNQHNLAEDEAYSTIKANLHRELLRWMEECGDKGQETELAAFEHQARNRKK